MAPLPASDSLWRLPARIGQILLAPRAAMARIDAPGEGGGGGLRDALWLVVLGTVTFRFPQLLEALLGVVGEPSVGTVSRVFAVLSSELLPAAWVVLPAAVAVTVAAGGRRDASLDLELGAACYAPYFVVRGLFRAVDAVAGARELPQLASEIPAVASALVALAAAIKVARSRAPRAPAEQAPADAGAPAVEPVAEPPAPPAPAGPRPARAAAVAGLAVLALTGVGLAGNAVWASRHMEALKPMRLGQPAPVFELPRLDGKGAIALNDLRGRVVVLDFWATWCAPCRALMPILDGLNKEWEPKGVTFLGVNSDGGGATLDDLRNFLVEYPVSYASVVDDGTANALYKIHALPSVVVIGRDGAVHKTFLGLIGRDGLAQTIREALAQ